MLIVNKYATHFLKGDLFGVSKYDRFLNAGEFML